MKSTPAHISLNICINSLRFALALVFVFSGFVKAIDPMGTVYKMADYADAFGIGVSPFWLLTGAGILIVVEYVMGVSLFFGLYRRFYLWSMIAFLAVMTPLTLFLALTNPISDCGCFGDAWVLSNWETFAKNVILLTMAIVVFRWRKLIFRFFTEKTDWLVSLFTSNYNSE